MAIRRSSTVRKVAKAPRPIKVAAVKVVPVLPEPDLTLMENVLPGEAALPLEVEDQRVPADAEFELSADEVAATTHSWPARQAFVGGPRDGQGAEVADHVTELRLGAGGVYRRSKDGATFVWHSPA